MIALGGLQKVLGGQAGNQMDHVFYECPPDCDDEHCNYCRGGLAFCTVCKQAEVELELTCPGPKPAEQPWWVYLVRCRDGSLYCGISTDIALRLEVHNSGKGSKYIRSRRPASLVWSEACDGQGQALRRECQIKRLTKRQKEALVTGGNDGGHPVHV